MNKRGNVSTGRFLRVLCKPRFYVLNLRVSGQYSETGSTLNFFENTPNFVCVKINNRKTGTGSSGLLLQCRCPLSVCSRWSPGARKWKRRSFVVNCFSTANPPVGSNDFHTGWRPTRSPSRYRTSNIDEIETHGYVGPKNKTDYNKD